MNKKKKSKITDREYNELQLLYKVSVSDLAFFKGQQWKVANYALLLYAALVGIAQLLRFSPLCCTTLLISLLATGVFIVAIWVIWELKRSIDGRRQRLERIRSYFSDCFQKAWEIEKTKNDATILFVVLFAVLAVGLFLVWWLVYFAQLVAS